ncbi:MAG: TM2 domain-containing protein [Spirochaetota bacterium]|nr:TM2 domain-containing protein [Spirochaetota bacterium]
MYSTGLAYFLWLISGFGAFGFHRFYLGKWGTGLIFMFTGGLGGFGSFYDLVTMPLQVREANLRDAYREAIFDRNAGTRPGFKSSDFKTSMRTEIKKDSLERVILKTAKNNQGIVTPSEVAVESGLSIDQAKRALEKLVSNGHADIRVSKNGNMVYFFQEFSKGNTHSDFEDFL